MNKNTILTLLLNISGAVIICIGFYLQIDTKGFDTFYKIYETSISMNIFAVINMIAAVIAYETAFNALWKNDMQNDCKFRCVFYLLAAILAAILIAGYFFIPKKMETFFALQKMQGACILVILIMRVTHKFRVIANKYREFKNAPREHAQNAVKEPIYAVFTTKKAVVRAIITMLIAAALGLLPHLPS